MQKTYDEKRPSDLEVFEVGKKNVLRKKTSTTSHSLNRLSVLSAESDKKSSESVEVLGSQSGTNTDCSITPDSDLDSINANSSVSVEHKENSESVEVLPDSAVTSPSSVEVLGEESPFVSPLDEKHFETSYLSSLNVRDDLSLHNESSTDGGTKIFFE